MCTGREQRGVHVRMVIYQEVCVCLRNSTVLQYMMEIDKEVGVRSAQTSERRMQDISELMAVCMSVRLLIQKDENAVEEVVDSGQEEDSDGCGVV